MVKFKHNGEGKFRNQLCAGGARLAYLKSVGGFEGTWGGKDVVGSSL